MLDIVKSADVFSTSSMRRILIAVVLRFRANLSWYSGGGRFHIGATPQVAMGEQKSQLPDRLLRRVRHVVTENRRVLDAASALRQNDLSRFGKLLTESHASLRDGYQVSLPGFDTLVGIARHFRCPRRPADRRRLRRLRRGRGHSRRSRGGQYRDHRTLP